MSRFFRNHRGKLAITALVALALATGVGLGPHLGFTASARTSLWSERTGQQAQAGGGERQHEADGGPASHEEPVRIG